MDKIPITFRAVIQRLQRTLAKEGRGLKKARGPVIQREFGQYYILSERSNLVDTRHVDPVALAQELGVLQPWEEVAEEDAATPAPPPVLDVPPYDVHKFRLGSLCQHSHNYEGSGSSLRRLIGGTCEECRKANQRKRP